jgi:hypothetical protein
MKTIKQTIRTPKNHEVRIKIPEQLPENDLVEITLVFKKGPDKFEDKIAELKAAMNDKIFLSDLKEISRDFEDSDLEDWPDK